MASSVAADTLIGRWRGEYFCRTGDAVGRVETVIESKDGALIATERYHRNGRTGTILYRVETTANPASARFSVDREWAQRQEIRPYSIDFLIDDRGQLKGEYRGHPNCDRQQLTQSAPPPTRSARAPAQNASPSTQNTPRTETRTALLPSAGFDLSQPEGVAVGMEFLAIEAALKKRGFFRLPGECTFFNSSNSRQRTKVLNVTTGPYRACAPGRIAIRIQFEQSNFQAASLDDVVKEANASLGAAGSCPPSASSRQISCVWSRPPNAPLLETVELSVRGVLLFVSNSAVNDISARAAAPAQPPSGPTDPEPWWEQELAKAKSKSDVSSGSARFANLSSDIQRRLRGEAETVFDYCKTQVSYAAFFDCACVAGRFIDARAANPAAGHDRTTLVGIAQMAAKVEQCPNKAGVAKHAHEQCVSTWRNVAPASFKRFCACFADVVANVYEKEPFSDMRRVTTAGMFAHQECEKKGLRLQRAVTP